MNVDLFGDGGESVPRPAWQVIEAARRQFLTGELVLDTDPPTHVYLRDGQVYFAERSTDGGLGVRLLVEGVITRSQLQKGTLLVSGAEHLGRLFERDTSIERESVELCVELMTDDVLVAVAEDEVTSYRMTMYKRHASGIDRWLPTKVEVITRLVERPEHADGEISSAPMPAPRLRPAVHTGPVPVVAEPAAEPAAESTDHEQAGDEVPAPATVETAELETADEPVETPSDEAVPTAVVEPVADTLPPPPTPFGAPVIRVKPASEGIPSALADAITGQVTSIAPSPALPVAMPAPTVEAEVDPDHSPPVATDDAAFSASIADEVAEAVRRALAAIDANA